VSEANQRDKDGAATGSSPTVGAALVDIAREHGSSVIFGVVSIHNQPLVEEAEHGFRFVPVRHEASAVNAADAYARASGALGVALTSTGTGAGNAAGSLIEALAAGSSVLHVTGQIDAEYLDHGRGVIHETKDQASMLEAVSKSTTTVRTASSAGTLLDAAARDARSAPMGPVSVEIPIDLQYQATTRHPSSPQRPVQPVPASIEAAAELINAAQRPVVWLGGGATQAGAEIRELVDAIGAGVFTSNAGRGTIDERADMVVGNFAATPGGADLLAEADLLISIGTHFRSNETRHYKLAMPTAHVQIDVDAAAIGRVHPASVGVVGDAAACVAALVEAVEDRPAEAAWAERVGVARQEVRRQLRADIGPYSELCDAMRSTMHDSSPFVRDVTIPASAWGNRLLDVYEPGTNINPRGGGIGQGLGMALGAAIARPDVPTFLMVGDGGLHVHLGELASVAQEQPWLVAIVFNDGGYGVLRNLQDHHFGRRSGVDLATPDFARLASAYGIEHRLIANASASASVLGDAVSLRAPVVVEVDCDSFGPMPKPFVPPVPVQSAPAS
jgi:acetolactate synthase-1/2/3 large subunit